MKTINHLLIISLVGILAFGCSKDAVTPTPVVGTSSQVDAGARKSADLDREMVLGKKLQNPYTVQNMKQAYKNIADKKEVLNLDIKANFMYVRFLPNDSIEYRRIHHDETFMLFDHPLDYEINVKGNKYKDPSTKDNKYTWYYCVVKVGQAIPEGIKQEVLADLYIPQNRSNNADQAKNNSPELETLLTELEKEALRITGNASNTSGGRVAAYNPSGRITMSDDRLGIVGVEGAKVRANRWFTTHEAITDGNGYFWMNETFDNPCNYSIIWERADFDILEGGSVENFQAYYEGPKQSGSWNLNIDGGRSLMYATIHRAAHYYYYQQNELRTPRKGEFSSRLSIAAYDWEQAPNNGEAMTSGFVKSWLSFPDIRIFRPSRGPYAIYSTTIHELAHAAHWAMNKQQFRNSEDAIIESWARCVQWRFTSIEYGRNWDSGVQYSDPRIQNGYNDVYTPIFIDMIDAVNQQGGFFRSDIYNGSVLQAPSHMVDNVSGYTPRQFEDILPTTTRMWSLRHYVRNTYDNPTENSLDELFASYNIF